MTWFGFRTSCSRARATDEPGSRLAVGHPEGLSDGIPVARGTRYIGDNPEERARQFAAMRRALGRPKPGDDQLPEPEPPAGQLDLDDQLSA
jgi:hypothetical protein